MDEIWVSIITINLNNEKGLAKTIESVFQQDLANFEYIIIDGNSNDMSVDLINRYRERLAYTVSEQDNGVYHAMNKGIQKATGRYCYFLNSGDYLWSKDTLRQVFNKIDDEDIVYGNMIHGGLEVVEHGPSPLSFFDFFTGSIYHQSAFIKRSLFAEIGLYNESFKIVSDWEFFVKAIFIHNCTIKYIDVNIARYETGGLSFQSPERNMKEREQVLEALFPRFRDDYRELEKYRSSNYAGIHRVIEANLVVQRMLDIILGISRFIKFRMLGRKH